MHIAYYDEAGDDGFPRYSSPLFVLTTCYLHYLNWKQTFETIREFRRNLKTTYGFPLKIELHTRPLLLNKEPYCQLSLSDQQRVDILTAVCDLIGQLQIRILNVVIVKPKITRSDYVVLDTAFKYSIQRLENDLDPTRNPENRFLIITDPGRLGVMRQTARRVQRINYIPSRFDPQSYRRDIQGMIEDPLPKDSKESFFIQLSDVVSYIVYLYGLNQTSVATPPKRLPTQVTTAQVTDWLDRMLPSLNTAAAPDPYGVKFHP